MAHTVITIHIMDAPVDFFQEEIGENYGMRSVNMDVELARS